MKHFEQVMSEVGKVLNELEFLNQNHCQMGATVDDLKWLYKVNLAQYPTKAADLHINLKDTTLTISGKSEVTKEKDFKVFSTHIWSKDIEVPKRLKKESLSAKLDDNDQLTLTADLEDASTNINVNLVEAEMD